MAGGDRRPAFSSVSKQPSEGHAPGCHQLSRTGVSDALIADKEQAAPDRFEPSVCPLLSPILASDLWPSPGAGLWRSTRGGIAGQMGHSVAVFDLCNAPSGRPASSPKHGRDASTFVSFLLLGGISELDRTSLQDWPLRIQCRRQSGNGAICSWCQSASLALAIPSGRRIQVAWDPRAPQQVRDGVETWIETQRQHPNLILTSSASLPQVGTDAGHPSRETRLLPRPYHHPVYSSGHRLVVVPHRRRGEGRSNPPCPLTAIPSPPPTSPSVHRPPRSAIAKFSQSPPPPHQDSKLGACTDEPRCPASSATTASGCLSVAASCASPPTLAIVGTSKCGGTAQARPGRCAPAAVAGVGGRGHCRGHEEPRQVVHGGEVVFAAAAAKCHHISCCLLVFANA